MTSSTSDPPPAAAAMTGESSLGVTGEAAGPAQDEERSTLRLVPGPHPRLDQGTDTFWGAFAQIDGRVVLATSGRDGTVRVWDPATGTVRHTLSPHPGPATGTVRHTLTPHPGEASLWGVIGQVGDQTVLATGAADGSVRVWDPATGTTRHTWSDPTGGAFWGASAQLGGRMVLATGGFAGSVRVWDPATGTLRHTLTGHPGSVVWGAFAQLADREVLATGGDDGAVGVWDAATGTLLHALTGHTRRVVWGAFAQLGDHIVLATGGYDGMVQVWDPATGTLRHALTGHSGSVWWGAFAQLGGQTVLATGGDDGAVRVWDPATGAALHTLTGHTGGGLWGAFAQLGDRVVLATGGNDGSVGVWDPATGAWLHTLTGHTGGGLWGAFAQLGDRVVLATGGNDGSVGVWEVVEELAVPRLPYRSDEAAGADVLDRSVEATALAELITSVSARPPLAVGLFGDWGEGKSYFLYLLQVQVRAAAAQGGPVAHQHVRQVRFNAWHYAETDLWASLVAEIFRQLAAPAEDDPQPGEGSAVEREARQREQARLAAELVARRGTAERLAVARAYRDELRAATAQAKPPRWPGLTAAQQADATRAARELAPDLAEQTAALYTAAARPGAWLRLRRLQLRQLRRSLSLGRLFGLLVAVVVVAGGVAGTVIAGSWLWHGAGVVVAALGVGGLISLGRGLREQAAAVWEQIGKVRGWLMRLGTAAERQTRTALEMADREVAALERELANLSAAGQLAGLVADRAAAGDYRRNLGLMTQIREDFEQMAKLLAPPPGPARAGDPNRDAAAAGVGRELGEGLPQIERIVLYIDDLDRCPPDRVVAMLEAIHLLLAVPLFVVVVAVDPRWLLRAISAHYRDLLDPDQPTASPKTGEEEGFDELAAGTPAQYLEKIFQVVMTLPPLRAAGYTTLLDTLIGVRADEAQSISDSVAVTDHVEVTVHDPTGPGAARAGNTTDPGASGAQPGDGPLSPGKPVELPAPRRTERIDPLALSAKERRLLELLGPPLITTPRSVKRLANSYGLFTALRRLRDQSAGEDKDPIASRAAMVLLAGLIGFPARGPRLVTELHRTAGSTLGWQGFLDQQAPDPEPADDNGDPRSDGVGRDRHSRPGKTAADREWIALIRALRVATERAHGAGLSLPEDLGDWRRWISDVGRLSFPAGPVAAGFETEEQADDATLRQ